MKPILIFVLFLSISATFGQETTLFPRPVSPLVAVHKITHFGCNAYLLETRNDLYLVDAGVPGMEKGILKTIRKIPDKKLRLIVITHGHFDHYGSARAVRGKTGALLGIHDADAKAICFGQTPIDSVKSWGRVLIPLLPLAERVFNVQGVAPDVLFSDHDSLNFYGIDAKIILTPGHTNGHCILVVQDSIAFTGDLVLTYGGVKRQDLFAHSWRQIDSSIALLKKINPAIIYTGHHQAVVTREELAGIK